MTWATACQSADPGQTQCAPKIATLFPPVCTLSAPSLSNTLYATRQRAPRRHLMGIVGVLVLHGLLLWAIQSGLARQVVKVTENTVEALLLSDNTPKPPPPPAPPPPKTPPPPTPTAPAPVVPSTTAPVISVPVAPPAPAPSSAAVVPVQQQSQTANICTAPRQNAAVICGCAPPEYPRISKRFDEEGVVSIKYLVDASGRLLKTDIEKSSGYARLDQAALSALSKCQFAPPMPNCKPEEGWGKMVIGFKLDASSESSRESGCRNN